MTLLNERFTYTPISRESVEGKRLYATAVVVAAVFEYKIF